MTKFLVKHFIKDSENFKDPLVRENYGKLAGIIGIISNLILCIIKVLVGVVSSSIAIIADGINNLTDASSSVITLIGFKLSSMPEDEDHPYGHARIEYLTGLIVSILIIIVGIGVLKTSIGKILNPQTLEFSIATIVVLIVAICIKLWQSLFNKTIGKKINSLTLIATATDSRNDVIATSIVLISVIITKVTGLQLDGYLGCLVALFIIWSGYCLIRETSSPLLGEAPDSELVMSITNIVNSYDGVLGMHDLVVHNYGPGKVFASLHVEVDAAKDVMESHDMVDNIEREISSKLHIHFVIHMDPILRNDPVINEVLPTLVDCITQIDGVYNMHDLRAVKGPTHTNIIFDLAITINCPLTQKEIFNIVQDELHKLNANYFVVITFDKAYTKIVYDD